MRFRIIFFFLFCCILVYANESIAQCALCKANAESDLKNGGTIAKGLNTGILYLMTVPYVILGTLFVLFFKKQLLEKYKNFKAKHFSSKIAS